MSHRITLRGHWVRGAGASYTRKFGRPTHAAGETVWLGTDAAGAGGTLYLNGNQLGRFAAGKPFAFDVTAALGPRNDVALEFDTDAEPGDVWVEMRG